MQPHEILGVGKDATPEEIRAAYRKLAMKWHPDRQLNNCEEATEKFAEINGAQRTLLRNIRRAKRKADASQNASTSSSSSSSESSSSDSSHTAESTCSSRPTSFGGSSESEASTSSQSQRTSYASEATGSSSPSSSSQKSGKTRRSKLQKSRPTASTSTPSSQRNFNPKTSETGTKEARFPESVDATLHPERPILPGAETSKTWTHVLNMTLEELYSGKTFHFRVVRFRDSGKKSKVPLTVEVPSGCRDGSEIIMPNAGNQRKDGTWQDIVFLIKELKHGRFQRVHDNLIMDVRLPWVDSLNDEEGEVYFQGVDGKEIMFRVDYRKRRLLSGSAVIPDAGMVLRSGNGRGKLVVRWEISSPMSSWESLREVLRFKKGPH